MRMGDERGAGLNEGVGTDHVLSTGHKLFVDHLACKVLSGLSGTSKQSRKSARRFWYVIEQAFDD